MTHRFELGTAPPARRALANQLPADIALATAELITGPLLDNPHRVGRRLGDELTGVHSARLGRDWRVRYEIDDARQVVIVLHIAHRSVAYRRR